VVAAQIPLTSFSADVAVLRKVLLRQEGPVVLAGQSYRGAVITAAAASNANVKALVYIAAIVPDEGETTGDVFHRAPQQSSVPKLQPDDDGFLWLTEHGCLPYRRGSGRFLIRNGSHGSNAEANCAQVPWGAHDQASSKRKTDMVSYRGKTPHESLETQRFVAERMKSKFVSLPVDHTPLASKPDAVAELTRASITNRLLYH
jgi:pimeloyl-ACP methyl ester carboxylesterase